MASIDASETEERLKSALWYQIGLYIDAKGAAEDFNATPQFIGALTELVYMQIANSARDLEVFSKHAGRRVVNTDDIMLLTRRNEALEVLVKRELDKIKAADGREEGGAQPKKRGRPSGTGAGGAKGKEKAKQ